MKVFLVADTWQFDDGLYILAAYAFHEEASKRMFAERMKYTDYNIEHAKKFPSSSRPIHSEHRILAIQVMELEVK